MTSHRDPNWLIVAVLVLAGAFAACGDGELPASSSTPAGATPSPPAFAQNIDRGITYCETDETALKMDIYYPPDETERMPTVLFLHAGAWFLGDKLTAGGIVDFGDLLSRGYVVASIDYGLAPQFPYPEQLDNAKCAVRFLRSEAGDRGVDPDRIAVWGASAGGHLAAMLGVTGDESSAVQAVVDLFGPADLEQPNFVPNADHIARVVFKAPSSGPSETLKRASPVTHVSADAPPFLIVHGDMDGVVPLSQSQALHLKLEEAGVDVTFVVVKNGDHGLSAPNMTPTAGDVQHMIGEFLDRVLADADTESASTDE